MSRGTVYLVGAGPGDPKLITLRGLELLKEADVIVYDFLVNKQLLAFAKDGAKLICAGKARNHHLMKQDEINALLVDKAQKAEMVVRLKCGDPFLFGRGAEEAAYLRERNIPVRVVPGLSSAIAVPTACGVPLTHRDHSASVAIMTGHRREGKELAIVNADTQLFLMTVSNLKNIVKKLIENGRSPDTPCMLIEKGTYKDERSVKSTLTNIVTESEKNCIKPPAIFIVGDTVS